MALDDIDLNRQEVNEKSADTPGQDFSDKLNKVKDDSKDGVKDAFGVSKEEVLQQLNEAQNIKQRVDLFATWTDKYGLEAILSRIPRLGDLGPAIISTCFLFDQGRKMGLGRKELLKIFGYQAADAFLGAIPFVGNIIDFFFKGNVYSAEIFEKHIEKLKQAAIAKGATQEEIASLERAKEETMNKMEEQINKKNN